MNPLIIDKSSEDFAVNRDLTIEGLILMLGLNSAAGTAMVTTMGWTSPLWLLVGAIALCFLALQQAIDDEDFRF